MIATPAAASFTAATRATATAATGLADRVRNLYSYSSSSLIGNALGALVVATLYWGVAPRTAWVAWLGAMATLWLVALGLAITYRRTGTTALHRDLIWMLAWSATVLSSAALWGAAAWLFYGHGQAMHQMVTVLIINCLCVGAIPSLAAHRQTYLAYVALAALPLVARIASSDAADRLPLAASVALIFGATLLLGRILHRGYDEKQVLKARTRSLIDQLQAEKRGAEKARADAEAATRAKTQFLAAASHDLRQPLHALGMFAVALRDRNQDPALRPLIDKMSLALEAMDDLFSELMDLSRLDAGAVPVRPRELRLDEIFARLRLHFEPLAFDKGLALTLRGGRQRVHTDPLLLERILRNLVSNAIRCTRDGGVLVAARPRGRQVLLQVWDSGVGIALQDQQRVFDEFVQVQAGPGPGSAEPARRKGLGLGLAIVRRLADLMQAPITLRSVPGRGSVFSLLLPMAAIGPPDMPEMPGTNETGRESQPGSVAQVT